VLFVKLRSGFVPSGTGQVAGGSITFNGISFTVPPSGNLSFKISNIRAAAGALTQVMASISSSSIPLSQTQVIVARSQTSLFATLDSNDIPCTGLAARFHYEPLDPLRGGDGFRFHAPYRKFRQRVFDARRRR